MSSHTQEAEVSGIEYVGPHTTRSDLYEIIVTLVEPGMAQRSRLSLLFRPADGVPHTPTSGAPTQHDDRGSCPDGHRAPSDMRWGSGRPSSGFAARIG